MNNGGIRDKTIKHSIIMILKTNFKPIPLRFTGIGISPVVMTYDSQDILNTSMAAHLKSVILFPVRGGLEYDEQVAVLPLSRSPSSHRPN